MPRAHKLSPRLLTKAEAASYCGVSLGAFSTLCPVCPIALGTDKRLERYDVVALNEWIDGLATSPAKRGRDWLGAMDRDNDGGSR
jgi:hypothetical protein